MAAVAEALRGPEAPPTPLLGQEIRPVFPRPEHIGQYRNPLKGIQILQRVERKRRAGEILDNTEYFSLMQDGVHNAYMKITHAEDGSPASLSIATRIPIPNSEAFQHYALMVYRNPETGLTEVQQYASDELTGYTPEYSFDDAIAGFIQVRGGKRVVHPAELLLQTASLYKALEEAPAEARLGSYKYVEEMLREAREPILTLGLPANDEIPTPPSISIYRNATEGEPIFQVGFQLHNSAHELTDAYSITAGESSDGTSSYLTIRNTSKDITYSTNGKEIAIHTPFGVITVAGIEAAAVMKTMQTAIDIAMTAVKSHVNAKTAHAVQQVTEEITRETAAMHEITEVIQERSRSGSPKTPGDQQTEQLARILAQENSQHRELLDRARQIEGALNEQEAGTSYNDAIIRFAEALLGRARQLVDERNPHGEIILEEGLRDERPVLANQTLFALTESQLVQVGTEDGPDVLLLETPLGEAKVKVQENIVYLTLPLIDRTIHLSLDSSSGDMTLESLSANGKPLTQFSPIPHQFALYATAQLLAGLATFHPDLTNQEIAATTGYITRQLQHAIPLPFGYTIEQPEVGPHATTNPAVIGNIYSSGRHAPSPFQRFVISTPYSGGEENRSIRVLFEGTNRKNTLEFYLQYADNARFIIIPHPNLENQTTVTIPLKPDNPAVQKAQQWLGNIADILRRSGQASDLEQTLREFAGIPTPPEETPEDDWLTVGRNPDDKGKSGGWVRRTLDQLFHRGGNENNATDDWLN